VLQDAEIHNSTEIVSVGQEDNLNASFEELIKVLAKPFEDQPEFAAYADPPKAEERVCQTFCGT